MNGRIVARYTAWEFWRNVRMVDSTFFVIVLSAAMYLMFGVGMNEVEMSAGHGITARSRSQNVGLDGTSAMARLCLPEKAIERTQRTG